MNNENMNYTVILESFLNYGLSDKELIIYSVIYGFTQNGQTFTGSYDYLKKWCRVKSDITILTCLNHLKKIGLIKKINSGVKNGKRYCEYITTNQISKNDIYSEKVAKNVDFTSKNNKQKKHISKIDIGNEKKHISIIDKLKYQFFTKHISKIDINNTIDNTIVNNTRVCSSSSSEKNEKSEKKANKVDNQKIVKPKKNKSTNKSNINDNNKNKANAKNNKFYNIFEKYIKNHNFALDKITMDYQKYGLDDELIMHAIEITANQGKLEIPKYLMSILENYKKNGYKNLNEVLEQEAKYKEKSKEKYKHNSKYKKKKSISRDVADDEPTSNEININNIGEVENVKKN